MNRPARHTYAPTAFLEETSRMVFSSMWLSFDERMGFLETLFYIRDQPITFKILDGQGEE